MPCESAWDLEDHGSILQVVQHFIPRPTDRLPAPKSLTRCHLDMLLHWNFHHLVLVFDLRHVNHLTRAAAKALDAKPWEFGSLGQRQRHSPSNSHDEFCFLTATACVSASWECARQFQASSETRPTPTHPTPMDESIVNHRHLLNLLNHRHLHTALHWHFNHLSGIKVEGIKKARTPFQMSQ